MQALFFSEIAEAVSWFRVDCIVAQKKIYFVMFIAAQFIELEQKARQDELSKYNITGNLELMSSYTIDRNYESLLKCSWQGQLYAKLDLGQ